MGDDGERAREQQAAIAHILQVIATSPGDEQRTLAAIAESAARYCGASDAQVWLLRGDALERVAHHGSAEEVAGAVTPDRTSVAGRAIMERRTIHIADVLGPEGASYPQTQARFRQVRHHAIVVVPILRDDVAIGSINLRKREPEPFTSEQVQLLESFANQAAIAIEHARLYRETKESLEQQTAIGDVLKRISASAFDLNATLETVIASAGRLCDADVAWIFRGEGPAYRVVARWLSDDYAFLAAELVPVSFRLTTPVRGAIAGRAYLDAKVINVEDIAADPELAAGSGGARRIGARSALAVPMIADGRAIGVIVLGRRTVRRFSEREVQLVETFADQAAIATQNVRLFTETKQALERQTAVAEILHAISSSPTDVVPVFDTILRSATRLCDAQRGIAYVRDGDELALVAALGLDPDVEAEFRARNAVATPASGLGRAIATRAPVAEGDLTDSDAYRSGDPLRRRTVERLRARSAFWVPLLKNDNVLGVLAIYREEMRPFDREQIDLVQTFADQASIALENVRLFNETTEALERQSAVAEVLATINQSAFELEMVLDTVTERARSLSRADVAWMAQIEGDHFTQVGTAGSDEDRRAMRQRWHAIQGRFELGEGSLMSHTIQAERAYQLDDIRAHPDIYAQSGTAALTGVRTALGVPMTRQGRIFGALIVGRKHVEAFSEHQIQVVETFAQQATIAIENVRLFNETKEALEQQTAISEILRVISSSPTDVGPVLEAIARSACRYAAAEDAAVVLVRDGALVAAAHDGPMSMPLTTPLDGSSVTARSIADRRTIHVPDVMATAEYPTSIQNSEVTGQRAVLATPLTRGGSMIGALLLRRREPRAFTPRQVELVETFAQQAAIAMENVRLFNETREALAQQTAVAEVLKTISRTVFDLEPTLQAVMDNAGRLADADIAFMNRRDAVGSGRGARYARTPALRAALGQADAEPPPPTWAFTRSVMGRMYASGRTLHVPDLVAESEMLEHSPTLRHVGARAVLAVPVRADGEIIIGCVVARLEPRPFEEHEIRIVETFADQAAIAIHNVRLFNQIQEKSAQLEVANRHKSEFLANMSHELRTPLNAVIGFSEVLLQGIFGDLNEKQREYLDDVLSSGKHLLSLINDILDLSKIEAGRMELDLSTFSLANALASGMTIVRERAARHGITLTAVVPDDLPPIEADERKVKQVLYNLLSNAVKFTPDGGRVDVRARREDGMVRIEVEDTGIGIAPEDHERVFEEFRQVGRERSREGTGLGLTLTKRFVELHGGRISFESTPGKGSTFTFTLPVRSAATVTA